MRCVRVAAVIGIVILLAGCAGPGPRRHAGDDFVGDANQAKCRDSYQSTDADIASISNNFQASDEKRTKFFTRMHARIKATDAALKSCWETAYEHHESYDLYFAEFDDAGQATDIAKGAIPAQSELRLIETRIQKAIGNDDDPGLNIVVFTHGWHGNARADNDYSTEFKAILQDIAARDTRYAKRISATSAPRAPHRVIGIEIAWRGNSLLTPALPFVADSQNAANVWDRKIAAETISTGAVQELLAFLNEYYLQHSCHGANAASQSGKAGCDRVHLLSLGHSFGALINFRALTPRLESGLNVPCGYRVFGFGDMTILLNPAFEGARYRALFNNAITRPVLYGPYFGDSQSVACPGMNSGTPAGHEVQIPSIVTLQSLGDTATETFFPIFRQLTTPFLQTLSPQELTEKDQALGWVTDFRTHNLDLVTEPNATPAAAPTDPSKTFCPFRPSPNGPTDCSIATPGNSNRSLRLSPQPRAPDQALPNYFPLWSVAVSPDIMRNHDDIWNPEIVRLIATLFEDAYEQTERMHGRARN